MAVFQATRDLAMAEAISDAASTGNLVVFYSGNEHTRKDQAVPYLAAKRGVTPAISISLQETTDGGKTLDRAEILKEIKGRYDYVWFIGEGLGIDHCAELTPGRMKRAD